MEWILSLVNGRIFCPDHMAGTRPRVRCNDRGQITVQQFREVFQDTGEEDLLLELFQKLEICIRFGNEQQSIAIPSLMMAKAPEGCWIPTPDDPSAVYYGLCVECIRPVGFSPSFFPRLQVRLYDMWQLNYGMEIPLWQGGLKLVQAFQGLHQALEAVVVLADDSFDTHIVVRCHRSDSGAALALRQVLFQQAKVVINEVSPGSEIKHHILANRSVETFSTQEKASLLHFSIEKLRQACTQRRPLAVAHGTTLQVASPEEAHENILPEDAVDFMQITDNLHGLLLDEEAVAIIDESVGEDWEQLAANLGFADREIQKIRIQTSGSNFRSATAIILNRWKKRHTAGFPELIRALQRSCFNRSTLAVELCQLRQQAVRRAIMTGELGEDG